MTTSDVVMVVHRIYTLPQTTVPRHITLEAFVWPMGGAALYAELLLTYRLAYSLTNTLLQCYVLCAEYA